MSLLTTSKERHSLNETRSQNVSRGIMDSRASADEPADAEAALEEMPWLVLALDRVSGLTDIAECRRLLRRLLLMRHVHAEAMLAELAAVRFEDALAATNNVNESKASKDDGKHLTISSDAPTHGTTSLQPVPSTPAGFGDPLGPVASPREIGLDFELPQDAKGNQRFGSRASNAALKRYTAATNHSIVAAIGGGKLPSEFGEMPGGYSRHAVALERRRTQLSSGTLNELSNVDPSLPSRLATERSDALATFASPRPVVTPRQGPGIMCCSSSNRDQRRMVTVTSFPHRDMSSPGGGCDMSSPAQGELSLFLDDETRGHRYLVMTEDDKELFAHLEDVLR